MNATATQLCFGDDAVWIGTPAGVLEVPDAAVRACLDCIDDEHLLVEGHPTPTVDVLAAALRRCLGNAMGGTGFVDDLMIVHPSHWGAPRRRVLEAAGRRCARDVTVVPTAVVVRGPANAARWVVLELAPLTATATLVERNRDTGPVPVACELAPVTGSLDLCEDLGAGAVLTGLVSAVEGGCAVDAVLVTGADDPDVRRIVAGTIAAATIVSPHELLRIDPPAPPPPPVVVPSRADRSSDPSSVRRPRRWPALAGAGALLVAAAVAGAVALSRPDSGSGRVDAEVLQRFEIGAVSVELPTGWRSQSTKPGRLDLTPDDAGTRRIVVIPTPLTAGSDVTAVARALEQRIADRGPDGPFSEFDPTAEFAGRGGVTYLESPDDRSRVRWHVLVEHAVQVSVGCQFRDGDWDALAHECDRALRSVVVDAP